MEIKTVSKISDYVIVNEIHPIYSFAFNIETNNLKALQKSELFTGYSSDNVFIISILGSSRMEAFQRAYLKAERMVTKSGFIQSQIKRPSHS